MTEFYRWVLRNSDIGRPPRDCGMGFEFRGRLWLSNGYQPGGITIRDLSASHDGVTWQGVNGATPYLGYAAICAVGDLMYAYDGSMRTSPDGVNWTVVSSSNNPVFEAEAPMFLVDGSLVILRTSHIDFFNISSGEFETFPTPCSSTVGHARIFFNGRFYFIGGSKPVANIPPEHASAYPAKTSLNDVWSSDNPRDPSTWVKSSPPFVPRMWPGVCAHAGRLYVSGGYDNFTGGNRSDTWRSSDGANWERVETTADYPARHAPTMYSRNGRLMLVCGNTNSGPSVQKDVWELVPSA